jgi:hypothetical protein
VDAPVDTGPAPLGPYPGDPGSLAEIVKSGSRLTARFDTANGVRRFVGFYDTTLNVRCSFTQAPDGEYYCFPFASSTFYEGTLAPYGDASCTEPAGVAVPCTGGTDAYMTSTNIGVCPFQTRLWQRGAETSIFYNTAGCNPASGLKGYKRGAEIAPAGTLVHADVVAVPHDAGATVLAYQLIAEDGSAVFLTLRDGVSDCTITPRTGGLRCLPAQSPSYFEASVYYPTSACSGESGPLATGPRCSGQEYAKSAIPACNVDDKFYKLGDKVEGAFAGIPGTCIKLFDSAYKADPNPTEITTFPAATALPLLPNVRLQPRRFALPDGTHGELGTYYDAELEADCSFALAEDGNMRCLPVAANVIEDLYEDSACTKPIKLASWQARCYLEPPAFAAIALPALDGGAQLCSGSAPAKYARLGPLRSGAVYMKTTDECKVAPLAPRAPLGKDLPASSFVAVQPASAIGGP